jgi:hypothetical protein
MGGVGSEEIMDMKDIVERNAYEESWLPDLLQEFVPGHPQISKSEVIDALSQTIKSLFAEGSIGIFSYIPSDKQGIVTDIDVSMLDAILSSSDNWEYGKFNQRVYALFKK